MVKFHESDRGRNILYLEAYLGQLHILRREMEKFVNYPRGRIITKVTRREYQSKTMGKRVYANFYDNLDVDGRQMHVSKRRKACSAEEMQEKYGKYDENDYRIKENLPGIRDKIKYQRHVEESVKEIERLAKEVRERLNFGKRKGDKEITQEKMERIGKRSAEQMEYAAGCREERIRKTVIARYGTKSQIEKEFESKRQLLFYLCDGKVMQTKNGEAVRSRAELVIADVLSELEIPYVYEYYVREAGVNCDFYISVGGKMYYMEVLGMMDREEYRERWEEKVRRYKEKGIIIGKNLIAVDLTEKEYLDREWMARLLSRIACRKVPKGIVYGVENVNAARKLKKKAESYRKW